MTAAPTTHRGWLALVATPIGNLEDITLRALRTLREAHLIAAEDTRRTGHLCQAYDIDTALVSYHAYNEHQKTRQLLDRVENGENVAVLSDAGTPAVSDPGFLAMRAAREREIEPVVIPGVSALTYAVVASGLPVHEFHFAGYPPSKKGKRRNFLERLAQMQTTVFLFESPYRMNRLLTDICEIIGGSTPVAIIREATKKYEECLRANAEILCNRHADTHWRGELVVGIDCRPSRKQNHTAGSADAKG